MRFHVRIKHGFVDTGVGALGALERLGVEVVTRVVVEVVLVLGDKRTMRTGEQFLGLDVRASVFPKGLL